MAQLRQAGVPSGIIAKVVVEKIAQKWTPLEAKFERQYLNDEIDAKPDQESNPADGRLAPACSGLIHLPSIRGRLGW
jgi:hypothetical protein